MHNTKDVVEGAGVALVTFIVITIFLYLLIALFAPIVVSIVNLTIKDVDMPVPSALWVIVHPFCGVILYALVASMSLMVSFVSILRRIRSLVGTGQDDIRATKRLSRPIKNSIKYVSLSIYRTAGYVVAACVVPFLAVVAALFLPLFYALGV